MHRLILPDTEMVDHINHDGLDNRRSNLRPATQGQNQGNVTKTSRATTSQYKGVSWYPRYCKWIARAPRGARQATIGYFDSEVDAALAYDYVAREYFGEFACLNFPDRIVPPPVQDATSKYRGVSWDSSRGKWAARVRRHFLGRFDLDTDAAFAYDDAARELFGEDAYLNFPERIAA
jgi:hypothetical protein